MLTGYGVARSGNESLTVRTHEMIGTQTRIMSLFRLPYDTRATVSTSTFILFTSLSRVALNALTNNRSLRLRKQNLLNLLDKCVF